MSYKNTILFQPTTSKYPFLLATEADGIPLTLEELEALHSECENALSLYDDAEIESHRAEYEAADDERDQEPHKRDGYAEKMADQADYLRKAARENGA